jgi:crotonobetainyl-CoA:carnitine CoA-transferase CaiB-like acyl-CoA transferase
VDRQEWIEDPRFLDAAARFENRKECIHLLDELFASRTLAEWREALATAAGVWAVAQTAREIHSDVQAIANAYLPDVTSDDGATFTLVASPVQFDESPVELRPGPEHGQHTEEVLLELGLSWEEIAEHKSAKAIL